MSGVFITFEGGDGVGKTTQIELLESYLLDRGFEVVKTREPGGTRLGAGIRQMLLHGSEEYGEIAPRAEALLYAADRAQHIAQVVQPALARGAIVLQDRYIDSSVAYQGAGRVLNTEDIRNISDWATASLAPDLTLLFDLDPKVAAERRSGRGGTADRMEAEASSFHEAVREQFLAIAKQEPARVVVISADQTPDAVAANVLAAAQALLPR